jgi:flagellar biosynthesis component FlhA
LVSPTLNGVTFGVAAAIMPGMRNIVLIAIVLALAIAAIQHESGRSSSDSSTSAEKTTSNGFLAAQHKYDQMWGDRATDDELMTVGRTICALHKRGMSDSDILKNTVGYRLPAGKARTVGLQRIRDAKKYLCP